MVVPLLVAATFWLLDRRLLAVIVFVAMASITAITFVSPGARRFVNRVTETLSSMIGSGLTIVLLGLVQALIFAPVSLAARLLRSDPLDPRSREVRSTRWMARGRKQHDLHDRQYGDERYRQASSGAPSPIGSPRWIRAFVGGVALLLAADVGLGSILIRLDRDEAPEFNGAVFGFDPLAQEALASQAGSAQLMEELAQVGIGNEDPFLGWRFGPEVTHQSTSVNVVDGVRSTRPSVLDGPHQEVWFLGGSTMYGAGQSDDATIASALVGLADDAGIGINATNLGHPAYANWQQVQLLEEELSAEVRPRPDVVVFYDGFNDMSLQTQFGVHDQPTHLFFDTPDLANADSSTVASTVTTWWSDHSAVALGAGRILDLFGDDEPTIQLTQADAPPIESINAEAAADAAVAIHRRGVEHVVALGEAYGFEVLFFWQPYLYTRAALTPSEQTLVGLPGYDTDVWLPMTQRVRESLADPVVDLSEVMDDEPSSIYWDFVHTNERGAAIVAEAIRPHLIAALTN